MSDTSTHEAVSARAARVAQLAGWPASELEVLGRCPVCQSPNRSTLFADVSDRFFGVPGAWAIRRCSDCDVAYLDPRPTLSSIGRAYDVYYTHESLTHQRGRTFRSMLGSLANICVRIRDDLYRTLIWPDQAPLGRLFRPLFNALAPRPIAAIACKFRHLQPAERKGSRLLDVGCGNGAFLPTAAKLGYDASGFDPDPSAVAQGRAEGLNLEVATFETFQGEPQSFDHILLSHVLEHFHDPVGALEKARELLAPGGRLWLVQPNLGARGLTEFGPYWRGLEVPRHMTLMNPDRLAALLRSLGFVDVELKQPPFEAGFYYQESEAARNRRADRADTALSDPEGWREKAREADRLAFADNSICESMTMVAYKPRAQRQDAAPAPKPA